ncbi:MAG: hypothetical protein HYU36_03715 [Planctomycetes bacterium]|nr:hypothetical protein [Planctomycetota bacterium]
MRSSRKVILGIVAMASCWLATALVLHWVEPEPLTADQILAKADWKPEELAAALGSATLESESFEKRRAVLEHVRSHLEKLPAPRRQEIVRAITAQRLERFRQHWNRLSSGEQKKLVEERLEELRERGRNATPEERERAKERLQSPEGQQFIKSAMEQFEQALNADERAALTPLVREWLSQMESL